MKLARSGTTECNADKNWRGEERGALRIQYEKLILHLPHLPFADYGQLGPQSHGSGPSEMSLLVENRSKGPDVVSARMQIQGDFRRKSNTACAPCKKRKIRCDRPGSETTEQPCSACRRHGWNCAAALDGDDVIPLKGPRPDRRRERTYLTPTASASASTASITSPDHCQTTSQLPPQEESPSSVSLPSFTSADSLKEFYERGIGSRDWNIFAAPPDKDPLRIVYAGSSIANLNCIVRQSSHALHFPFPPIRPRLSWEPSPARLTYLSTAAVRDLSSLPQREIRDSLVDTYFKCIHPGLPIIDANEFYSQYASADPSPPLLLLQCMLLAAARVSKHPKVAASRSEMTASLYRRAKALFEMRHENDRVILVQSALLLTWHVEDSDFVSNGPYYWIGLATRIALGLGMHRDRSDNSASRMPLADRRLYRRLWWTTLRFEVYTALEYGRPPMIRTEDFDQTALEPADFLCGDGNDDRFACPEFCILDARLCVLALDIIRLAAPGTISRVNEEAAIDRRLMLLAAELSSTLDFWSCQLRITHSLLTLMLHRARRHPNSDSAFTGREAVSTILVTFETILAQDTIASLNYYACTPLLAAAVYFAQSITCTSTEPSSMNAYTSFAQLERLLKPIEALAKAWPHMASVCKLSKLLSSHCRRIVFRVELSSTEQAPIDLEDITLDDLLSQYCFPTLAQTFDETDQGLQGIP